MDTTFDISKRNTVKKAAAASVFILTTGGILLPKRAQAFDPATLFVLIGTIIGSAFQYRAATESARIAAEGKLKETDLLMAIEKMKNEFTFKMKMYDLGGSGVYQQTAFDRSGSPAKQGWSNDIDNAGGYIGLSEGQIATARGKYDGTMNTAEADRFATGVARGYPMPVPVENGYHSYSSKESDMLHAKFDGRIGNDAKYLGGRHYSSAGTPTQAGWDIETVMYANESGKGGVNAMLVPRKTMLA